MTGTRNRASSLLCLVFLTSLATSYQPRDLSLSKPIPLPALNVHYFQDAIATRLLSHFSAPGDLWGRIRAGFTWEKAEDNPRVQKHIQAFLKAPHSLEAIAHNAAPYLYLVVDEIERRGMPMELALLPMVESRYEPHARSHVGASGLWQIMPATGRHLGLKRTNWYDGRKDIQASTEAALSYLDFFNTDAFEGDWLLSLAAYNAGEGNVRKAMRRNARVGKPLDYWNLPLPNETENYVPKLLALAILLSEPEKYGLELPKLADQPHLISISVDAHTKLSEVIKLSSISSEDFYNLNPAFTRSARPNQDYQILLPIENARLLEANLKV